jgi:hypothetical protein
MNDPLPITIFKPIHGTFCSIDKRKLVEALREDRNLEITVIGVGCAIVSPQWWWDTAVKKEKRVMKYKNYPLTLVYNFVPIKSYYEKNKDVVPDQLSLL